MPDFHLVLLGQFQAIVDGEALTGFLSNKVRALLAYLASENDRPHSRESLAGLLWPHNPDRDARASLRTALANLRKVLRDHQEQPLFLHADAQSIRFLPGSSAWVDLHVFLELTSTLIPGISLDITESKINIMERAVDLYRGAFLEGFYLEGCRRFEEWVEIRREQVNRKLSETLHILLDHFEHQANYDRAIQYARHQLKLEPWDEYAHQSVMRLLARSGNRSGALAQYATCCRLLAEELEVAPTPETTRLFIKIRDGEFGKSIEIIRPPGRNRDQKSFPSILIPSLLLEESQEEEQSRAFVARQEELNCLQNHLDGMLAGIGRVVFIQGEAGIGKSTLLHEFARRAATQPNLITISGKGSSFNGVGDPYQPFQEALRMLSGTSGLEMNSGILSKENARRLWELVPEVIRAILEGGRGLVETLLPLKSLEDSLLRASPLEYNLLSALEDISLEDTPPDLLHHPALFEEITSILQIISQEYPLILILDDLQWIDRCSAALLFHLGRRVAGLKILILGAFRAHEIDKGWSGEEHPLRPVVIELTHRSADTILDLDQADRVAFFQQRLANQPNRFSQEFSEQLYRLTRGHPLFTIEVMKDMQERGSIIQDSEGRWTEADTLDWSHIPVRVEAVFADRFQRLPVNCQDILSTASVEGEEFTAEVLAHALVLPIQQVVDYLSGPLSKTYHIVEALQRIRIADRTLSRYRFHHRIFQKYCYQQLDLVKRSSLHEAIGEALECIHAEGVTESKPIPSQVIIQLAYHFEAAGIEAKAARFLVRLGDYARQISSFQDAIEHYQRALRLLRSCHDHEGTAHTLMKLGIAQHILFQFAEAHKTFTEGFRLWQYTSQSSSEVLSPASQPLRIDWEALPSFDPAYAYDIASADVNNQLFSGLLTLNFNGDLLPEAAASWQVLDQGHRYIFSIRENLCWSDGSPLTAKDFEYAWKRNLHPATCSPFSPMFFPINGALEFNQGISTEPDSVGIRALDDHTFIVDLLRPIAFFPYLVTLPGFKPVPQHVVERYGHAWTDVDKIQTNGPFRLDAWKEGRVASFVCNPAYHGEFHGNLTRVELYVLPDWRDRLEMYQADELDVLDATWLPPQPAERMRLSHAGEFVSKPLLLTGYLGFNVSKPPFDDKRVRQAFGLALDKGLLTDVIGRGHLPPASGGFVPPGMPGHIEDIGLNYNPEKALQLLTEAGYPGGRGFPEIEYWLPRGAVMVDMEFIQHQWQMNLGLSFDSKIVELTELYQQLQDDPPNLYAFSWVPDYPDPDSFLGASGVVAATRWQNPAFDHLVNEAAKASDPEERLVLYHQAEHILIEEAPILPIVYGQQHLLLKPWVQKFPTSTSRYVHWKEVVMQR